MFGKSTRFNPFVKRVLKNLIINFIMSKTTIEVNHYKEVLESFIKGLEVIKDLGLDDKADVCLDLLIKIKEKAERK